MVRRALLLATLGLARASVIIVDPTTPTVRETKQTLAKLQADIDSVLSSLDEFQLSHSRKQKLEALSETLASARDAADDCLDVNRPSTPLVLSHAFCHAMFESSRCLLEVVGLTTICRAQYADLRTPSAGAVLLVVFATLFSCRSIALWVCSRIIRPADGSQSRWLGRALLDLCGILGVFARLWAPEEKPAEAKRRGR